MKYLVRIGDYKDSVSMLNTLNKLEKLEIIESAVEWMIFRNIRNSLIHEYPDNEEEIVQGIRVLKSH